MVPALLVALAAVAQSPTWPAASPDLPAAELARPELMPGDPDYAPREDPRIGCAGQLELFGFTPACTPLIAAAERESGSGVAADRAWLLTTGAPSVTIAVLDTGADWADRELAGKWRLDEGELPAPRVGGVEGAHDRNGDGAFTPLDYTSATGTAAPSIERVIDDRLRARDRHGDANDNGVLDPEDLLAAFGDGRDGDGDGLRDEIAGFDFADTDADAADPDGATSHGAELARVAAAETNNGVGGAGACPRCTVMPLRVAGPDAARGEVYAEAVVWAARAGARVIVVGTPPDYGTRALDAAIAEATARGVLVIATAGDLGGIARAPALARGGALIVSALVHDAIDRRQATSARAASRGASLALERGVSAPGATDAHAAALAGGVAALVLAAAEGAAGAPALSPPLSPAELRQLLQTSAAGWSLAEASGRIDARAAVDAVLSRAIPPVVELVSPAFGTLADPTPDLPVSVSARVTARGEDLEWTLASAVGAAAPPDAFTTVASGAGDAPVVASLPVVGAFRDPVAPPGPPLAFAISVRLVASARAGARLVRASAERVVWAHRDVAAVPGFPRDVGGMVAAAPRALDVDGDGREEILVATTDGVLTWIGARGALGGGWPFVTPPRAPLFQGAPETHAALAATPAIAELVAGAGRAVVAVSEDGELYALDATGAPVDGFPVSLGRRAGRFAGPAVRDLDGDGVAEIVVASADGALDVITGRGGRRARVRGAGPLSAPALSEDGRILVLRGSTLEAWSADGLRTSATELGGPPPARGRRPPPPGPVVLRSGGVVGAPIGGTVTRAGDADVVTRAGVGARAELPASAGALTVRAGELAAADFDLDGRVDVVAPVVADSGIAAIAGWAGDRGRALAGFPLEARLASPVTFGVIDLDGDGRPEAVFADDHLRLRAVSADGVVPKAWPKLVTGPTAGVAAADLFALGRWDVAAVTAEGALFAWRTGADKGGALAWDGPRHDAAATGDAAAPLFRRSADGEVSSCQHARASLPAALLALIALAWGRARRSERA